jgi:nucleoside-diphosphate-sugar epimerase
LPERWITEPRTFHNTYEQAKAEAELLVADHIHSGLPATVHRPSMVIGDARSGKVIHFQIFYHLAEFLSGRRTRGFFPALGATKLDVVPVDYVARSIVWSSMRPETVGRVFHLCAGPTAALPLGILRDRIRAWFENAGMRLPRVRTVPAGLFRAAVPLMNLAISERGRRALAALPIFLDYLAAEQVFENAQSTRMLATAGIAFPDIDAALSNVLSYYLAQRSISREMSLSARGGVQPR